MSNGSAYGGRRLSLREMARLDLIPRKEGADGERRGGTRISAQSFSAGNAAWKGRVGEDRSAPNSFGNPASLKTMWAGRFLNSSESLRDRWGADGFINNAAERQASFDSRTGAKPAAAAPGRDATAAAGSGMLKNKDGTTYDPFGVLSDQQTQQVAGGTDGALELMDEEMNSAQDRYSVASSMGAIPSVFEQGTADGLATLTANAFRGYA